MLRTGHDYTGLQKGKWAEKKLCIGCARASKNGSKINKKELTIIITYQQDNARKNQRKSRKIKVLGARINVISLEVFMIIKVRSFDCP